MLGWQAAGKILADNLEACLQPSRTDEGEDTPLDAAAESRRPHSCI